MRLLFVKTKEGYTIKVIAELLQNYVKDGCFIITQKGIELVGTDSKTKEGTKLIHMELFKKNFIKYICPETSLRIGLNLSHFYKMLKSIKKKDTLTLFIDKEDPLHLGIEIHQNGDINGTKSYVRITQVQPVNYQHIEGYNESITTTSKEFLKLKQLNKISKTLIATATRNKIEFFSDKEEMYARKVTFGDNDNDEENEEMDENFDDEEYKQTFSTEDIIQLVKIGGLSPTIQIYATNDLPLKFEFTASSLGIVQVHIKSNEILEAENEAENGDEV